MTGLSPYACYQPQHTDKELLSFQIPIALLFFPWMVRKLGVKAAVQWTLVAGMLQALTPLLRMLGYGSLTLQIVSMVVVAIRR